MARIELRNATIRLVDGYSNTAAVNDTPAADDTTLTIDTVLGVDASGDGSNPANKIIPLSTRFTVVGSTEKYTVTDQDANAQLDIDLDVGTGNFTITIDGEVSANIAHDALVATIQAAVDAITGVTAGDFLVTKPTASTVTVKALADGAFEDTAVTMSADLGSLTGGAPTQVQTYAGAETHDITFTPALATADGLPIDDAVITFTGRTLSIKVGEGNLNFTENREFIYDTDRGLLDTVRAGNDVPMDLTFDIVWEELSSIAGATTPTPREVLSRAGAAAGWKSSSDDSCEPFAIDVELEHIPPCGVTGAEDLTFPDFRWESRDYSAQDAQINVSGRCNATEAIAARLSA